jgi:putative transposase
MPFKETCAVEERIAMFRDYETGAFAVTDLCRRYEVSRETFYVWKRRRDAGNEWWFEERSRAPEHCPQATPQAQVAQIVAMRKRFPRFGARKVLSKLVEERPQVDWPAASTIGDILKREGLIVARDRRRRPVPMGEIVAGASEPNGEWSIDFKGWFRTRDGERCDPLTVEDTASRYLVETRIVEPTWAGVRLALERVFAEVGLPEAIRSDNGSPFGSTGCGRSVEPVGVVAQAWHCTALHPAIVAPG